MIYIIKFTAFLIFVSLSSSVVMASFDGNAEVNCNLHSNDYRDVAEAQKIVDFITADLPAAEAKEQAKTID